MALLQVTPEMMRATAQKIETALEHATVIANQYLANHEAMGAEWQGDGYMSSTNTAGKVQHGLVQATIFGNHLKDALIKAAMMMEQHEMDASHSLSSFGAVGT